MSDIINHGLFVSLTNRGLLLILRGWLKAQQKNNLCTKGVSTRHLQYVTRVCDTSNIPTAIQCLIIAHILPLRHDFVGTFYKFGGCWRGVRQTSLWYLSHPRARLWPSLGVCANMGKLKAHADKLSLARDQKSNKSPSILAYWHQQVSRIPDFPLPNFDVNFFIRFTIFPTSFCDL